MRRKFPIMETKPEHQPTDEARQKVIDLSCNGFNQADIADYLDIDEKTLRKHYRKELDNSKRDKTIALGNKLYLRALDGDAGAQEFWLKCQGRWSYAKSPEDSEKDAKQFSLLEKVIDKL
jgi:hypothetical protein